MALKKKQEAEAGAPAWLLTWGDMCTLLLCFFVFLIISAKIDASKLVEASGYMADKVGLLPDSTNKMDTKDSSRKKKGEPGSDNKNMIIEKGAALSIGGRQLFETGGAVLNAGNPEVYESLLDTARKIRGLRNIVELRGHVGPDEEIGGSFRDAMDLSLERARAVRDFLVNTGKIPVDRLRLTGCGSYELAESGPIKGEDVNRRVEIRVTEKFQDFNPNTNIK